MANDRENNRAWMRDAKARELIYQRKAGGQHARAARRPYAKGHGTQQGLRTQGRHLSSGGQSEGSQYHGSRLEQNVLLVWKLDNDVQLTSDALGVTFKSREPQRANSAGLDFGHALFG